MTRTDPPVGADVTAALDAGADPASAATPARSPQQLAIELHAALTASVRGKREAIRLVLSAVLSGGHVLIEDVPGTGKTLLCRAIAASLGGRFGRVQCTPDLLPTDITGTSVFRPDSGDWEFHPGPLFANVVLIDEINRASPRTQSALLEPMEEHQVTVDGRTRALPQPFLCIATQNPRGQVGTFPLPESQLDRFALSLSLGMPGRDAEREVLSGVGGVAALQGTRAVAEPAEVPAAIGATRSLYCAPAIMEYVLDLADATRSEPRLGHGASPRASLGVLQLARGHAVVSGRDHVIPDDVQAVFVGALTHRVNTGERGDSAAARDALGAVLARVPVPRP